MATRLGRIYRFRPISTCISRKHSTSVYADFKKLRAYPFRMTPEEAQRTLAMWAAPICDSKKMWSSALAWFFPMTNYIRPIRFSPVYFPAWVVNAEIEADISQGDAHHSRTLFFQNSYIPGSHMPTLSAAPLWARVLDGHPPEPFSESMIKQHGEEVQCIPFTTSPFSVLDAARNLSWSEATLDESLKFSPSSVKASLFSAYPVLLPLYLGQYQIMHRDGTPKDTVSFFIPAYTKTSDIMSEPFLHKLSEVPGKAFQVVADLFDINLEDAETIQFQPSDSQVLVDAPSLTASRAASDVISQWLSNVLKSSKNIEQLVSPLDNDNDPRIREMNSEEGGKLRDYFNCVKEITVVKMILAEISRADPTARVVSIGGNAGSFVKNANQASTVLQGRLIELETKQKELKPQWWIDWELSNGQQPS